ncbi:hypothetical protein [Oscillatoria sp. FACHB-1406]|uniref:hypothetical protein n=1 Tax=Oscillatoria sp. FACHB-1406 TaxID=2692846 RepID=UPI001F548778|nr:hypothetical protein [Oscillatoria sp. FACHB-1406]
MAISTDYHFENLVGKFMTSKKVLIVDDEPNILILMEQALEKLEEEGDIQLTGL